jgi:ArsR family transcriptional regulator, arsenate/arsenite/antimonite-responsive transcriptional repressor
MDSKKYTEDNNEIAVFCKALAHPARITIIRLLLSIDSCYCNDIVKELPLAQSTVSQHLKELKKAGLIKGNITPPQVKYCIDKENWKKARHALRITLDI